MAGTTFTYTIPHADKLYPPVEVLDPNPPKNNLLKKKIATMGDVVAHYTLSSLNCDNIKVAVDGNGVPQISGVMQDDGSCTLNIAVDPSVNPRVLSFFAEMHLLSLDENHGVLAFSTAGMLQEIGVWNPMSGYPANHYGDPCLWAPFLPLGMGMCNHKAVTLLHYPPYVAMQNADYLHNQTLFRWQMLLKCNGISPQDVGYYNTFVDVNPIAAPGSGQSEYPNDYLPIMMAQLYDRDPSYIRNMLDLLLNPPYNANNPFTLPLLVGGSPDYDPQAPGWFRIRFKDQLPKDKNGIPQAVVGQVGRIRILEKSQKETPYMIVNHMIAAGVQGLCTSNAASPCDIRTYEAHDLAAATFLRLIADNPSIDPESARSIAFQRWFGNPDGTGVPMPPDPNDKLTLCAMAQMDLNFEPGKTDDQRFSEALDRCRNSPDGDPCGKTMKRDNKPCCCS